MCQVYFRYRVFTYTASAPASSPDFCSCFTHTWNVVLEWYDYKLQEDVAEKEGIYVANSDALSPFELQIFKETNSKHAKHLSSATCFNNIIPRNLLLQFPIYVYIYIYIYQAIIQFSVWVSINRKWVCTFCFCFLKIFSANSFFEIRSVCVKIRLFEDTFKRNYIPIGAS